MELAKSIEPLIIFLAIWDEDLGPKIVKYYPKNENIDFNRLDEMSAQIFLSFQAIFGTSEDVKFDKTKLLLPLKSYKKYAKTLLDAYGDIDVRGGNNPFIFVVLTPVFFPEDKLSKYEEIQEKVVEEYKKTHNINIESIYEEVKVISEQIAREVKHQGDEFAKTLTYNAALQKYENSIDILISSGLEKHVPVVNRVMGQILYKKAKIMLNRVPEKLRNLHVTDAFNEVNSALENVYRTNDEGFIQDIEKQANLGYEKISDTLRKKAIDAYKGSKWAKAIRLFKKSIFIIGKTKNPNLIDDRRQEYLRLVEENLKDINKSAEKALQENNYRNAIEIYQVLLEIAKSAKDKKVIEDYESNINLMFEKYAHQIKETANTFFEQGNLIAAERAYLKSIQFAKESNNKLMVENFKEQLYELYSKWANYLVKKGKFLASEKEYKNAATIFDMAYDVVNRTKSRERKRPIRESRSKFYKGWAEQIKAKGNLAYNKNKFLTAYKIYSEAMSLAEIAEDRDLIKFLKKARKTSLIKSRKR